MVSRREKEVILKAEAGEAARRASAIADARTADLESKLQQCMTDRDNLQLRLDEANQASGTIPHLMLMSLKLNVSTLGSLFENYI